MSNNINTCIFAAFQQKKEEEKKETSFAVQVDDSIGFCLSELLKTVNKYKKVDFLKADSLVSKGDILVFTKDDVRVTSVSSYLMHSRLDIPVYSLVNDYFEIVSKVEKLYKKNLPHKECEGCPYYKTSREIRDIFFDGDFISSDEKVSVFNNFVKIGYDTYDIYKKNNTKVVNIDNIIYEVIKNNKNKCFKKDSNCLKKLCHAICG